MAAVLVACGGPDAAIESTTTAIIADTTTTSRQATTTTVRATTTSTTRVATTAPPTTTTTRHDFLVEVTDELVQDLVFASILAFMDTKYSVENFETIAYQELTAAGTGSACGNLSVDSSLPRVISAVLEATGAADPALWGQDELTLVTFFLTDAVDLMCPTLGLDLDGTTPATLLISNAFAEITGGEVIDPSTVILNGIWIVGTDIQPGTYRAEASSGCYWERLSGFGGTNSDIIANEFSDDAQIVTIAASDAGFNTEDCGMWILVE